MSTFARWSIALALLPVTVMAQSPYEARRTDLGFEVDIEKDDPLLVTQVAAGGPAEAAGIAVGDAVLRVGGVELKGGQHFFYLGYYVLPPDAEVEVVVRRGAEERTFRVQAGSVPIVSPLFQEGGRTVFHRDEEIYPDLESDADWFERAIRLLAQKNGQAEKLAHLERILVADEDRWVDWFRLDAVCFARRNPLKAHRVADRLASDVRRVSTEGWAALPATAARWIDAPIGEVEAPAPLAGADPDAVLATAAKIVAAAEEHRVKAFAGLTEEEYRYAGLQGNDLALSFVAHIYVSGSHQKNTDVNQRVIRLAKKVDYAELARMAASLSGLWVTTALGRLRAALAGAPARPAPAARGVEGDVLAWLDGPEGAFVIGGPGPNAYRGKYAFILDVGGDDVYEPGVTSLWYKSIGPRIGGILDLAGNDRYAGGKSAVAQGAGWLGAGVHVDLAGDDVYELVRLGQGFGFLGFGLLLDAAGADSYTIGELGQGAALFGYGALLDLGPGADSYTAKEESQGLGGPKGFGLLHDAEGDSTYFCGGHYVSTYGAQDGFCGLGQGIGIGFRRDATGGIGLLLDRAGHDRYEGGNFSQGMGYFEGLGVLADDEGNDAYKVNHYGQGSGCHYAVGVFLEAGGDDRYEGKGGATLGTAWDAAVGILIDAAGDDRYDADGFSLGAGSQNGFGVNYDAGGRDVYPGGKRRMGSGGSNTYWFGRGGGPSYGVFLDLGSAGDEYPGDEPSNDTTSTGSDVGLFFDSAGDLVTVLAGDPDADAILAARARAEAEAKRQAEEAAAEAKRRAELAAREEAARALYGAAEEEFRRKDYRRAIESFRKVGESHGDVEWGRRAAARATELEADPAIRQAIDAARRDTDCKQWLSMGKNYYNNGKKQAAAEWFRKVVDTYPDSPQAREAKEWLAKIR